MLSLKAGRRILLAGISVLALSGCSEVGFQDFFGAGKYAPDESQVAPQQSLVMPPDLQLRPPSSAAAPPPQQQATAAPPVSTQPPAYQPAPQDLQTGSYQAPQPGQPAVASTDPYVPSNPQPSQPQDVYARYGISKYNADGSEKTQAELRQELRAAVVAEKKRQNPNYGTVYNIGNIFND